MLFSQKKNPTNNKYQNQEKEMPAAECLGCISQSLITLY